MDSFWYINNVAQESISLHFDSKTLININQHVIKGYTLTKYVHSSYLNTFALITKLVFYNKNSAH